MIDLDIDAIKSELDAFTEFDSETVASTTVVDVGRRRFKVDTFANEFWTRRQRAGARLHEVSYRACFKPQLPRFFIERLTERGDSVYDPFMGRGTTLLEAAILERIPYGCDANPLSIELIRPRLAPPPLSEVRERLDEIPFSRRGISLKRDLLVFFHEETLRQIAALKSFLKAQKKKAGELGPVDSWIQMVAANRLTGHSPGFFSVYTLPPNQAVSIKAQIKINERLDLDPEPKDVSALILRKSKALLRDMSDTERERIASVSGRGGLACADSTAVAPFKRASMDLVVTSPPFLDVVDYNADNWMRNWFCGNSSTPSLAVLSDLAEWENAMQGAFRRMKYMLRPGGFVAFEVGEVRKGSVRLEEAALRAGIRAGLHPQLILINAQEFTKTANCWGVENRTKGTNTNRVVVLRKP